MPDFIGAFVINLAIYQDQKIPIGTFVEIITSS